jgi:plasmid stabilization system protein ParE
VASIYEVSWTPEAEGDAQQITDDFDDPINAEKVVDQFEDRANRLARLPNQGRVVPELRKIGVVKYREVIIMPWRMVYMIQRDTVWIMGVLDGRRNLQDLLFERFARS